MTQEAVIVARDLTKRYGNLVAVDGVSFSIRRGECFGLLGPNGAGKTSTMRMISCVSPVSGGELLVDGKDVRREQREIKRVLGVVSQADSLDPELTVHQNLAAHARYFDIPREVAERRIGEALELFHLSDKLRQTPDELSGGMRRRLLVARALLHEPRVLVLDEPTTGLDPQTRHLVWDRLLLLRSQGITVLLTTHYMEEASYLCDRLVVIDMGRILVEGTPRELVRRHTGEVVVEVRAGYGEKASLLSALGETEADFEDGGESVLLYGDEASLEPHWPLVDGYEVVRRPGNLEDVFLRLTGRGLREE